MATRYLLPHLPAELRNEVYSYLAPPTTESGSTFNLPFTSKTYETSHATVTISAVHNGNHALLKLQKYGFHEATEYWSWLEAHALEIRIAIVFRGNCDTFVQHHWDEKMLRSLKKLVAKWPFLWRARAVDLRIAYEANINGYRKEKKNTVGRVARGMASTILRFYEGKTEDVRARLCIPHYLGVARVASGPAFDLGWWIYQRKGDAKFKKQAWEVSVRGKENRGQKDRASMVPVKDMLEDARDPGLLIENGKAKIAWTDKTRGVLVMHRVVVEAEKEVSRMELREFFKHRSDQDLFLIKLIIPTMHEECSKGNFAVLW